MWHVGIQDRPRLVAELADLDRRLLELDDAIRHATNRQRYGGTPEETARAGEDLARLVADLDRLMTRKRAVEGKLLLIEKMAATPQHEGKPGRDRDGERNEWADRLAVEVWRRLHEHGTG